MLQSSGSDAFVSHTSFAPQITVRVYKGWSMQGLFPAQTTMRIRLPHFANSWILYDAGKSLLDVTVSIRTMSVDIPLLIA